MSDFEKIKDYECTDRTAGTRCYLGIVTNEDGKITSYGVYFYANGLKEAEFSRRAELLNTIVAGGSEVENGAASFTCKGNVEAIIAAVKLVRPEHNLLTPDSITQLEKRYGDLKQDANYPIETPQAEITEATTNQLEILKEAARVKV